MHYKAFIYFVGPFTETIVYTMKNRCLLTLGFALAFSCAASAQLKLPVTNNDLRTNLQKVVADFPNHLSSVIGEVKAENPQTTDFASTLDFQTAEENFVTRYDGKKPIYSWQATLLTASEFEDAAKKYKWLCNQLKSMTLRLGDYSFSLDGEYEAPDDGKKFSASLYRLMPASVSHPRLKIEAGLQYYFPEWKVILTVYEKEREDKDRGPEKEGE